MTKNEATGLRKSHSAPEKKCDFGECVGHDAASKNLQTLNAEIRTVVELCVLVIRHVSDARHMCDFANNTSTDNLCLTE
jgi:hypothetical protein